jgi:hypothetical protein
LRESPLHWAFAGASIRVLGPHALRVTLPFVWRRFPYVLTAVATAPRSVPGPFRIGAATSDRVVVRRGRVSVIFRRLDARTAVREFRAGRLDEAPVPLGEIAATRADARIGAALRTRRLLGLDVVFFAPIAYELRRAYRDTADRVDYAALIPEQPDASAYGFLGGEQGDPALYRRALKRMSSLPHKLIKFAAPHDPALGEGARLLYAQWRDMGLGPELVSGDVTKPHAALRRIIAVYPQQEAIPAELVLREELSPRALLLRALAATQQGDDLERLDAALWRSARAVPIAWVVDARLASPRLRGWRESALGDVDYSVVRSLASSRSRSP